MTLNEALQKADEAEKEMYCSQYPIACVVLAKEIRKLQRKLKKQDKLFKLLAGNGLPVEEGEEECSES